MGADVGRLVAHAGEVVFLSVHRADLRQRVQRLRQCILKHLERPVFAPLHVLDAFTHQSGKQDHRRVQQQDHQRQLPMDPEQHPGHAHQREHRYHQAGNRRPQKVIDGVEIGHEMRGYAARPHGFEFGQRNARKPVQHLCPDAVHHVFCQQGKAAALPHVEQHRRQPQGQRQQQCRTDEKHRAMPGGRGHCCNLSDEGPGMVQQHLVDHQRQQQGQGNGRDHGENRHDIGLDQSAPMGTDVGSNGVPGQHEQRRLINENAKQPAYRVCLLADAERTENFTQQIVGRKRARDFSQRGLRQPQFFGKEFELWRTVTACVQMPRRAR